MTLRARDCRSEPVVDRVSSRVALVRSARQACAAGSTEAIRPVTDNTAMDARSTSTLMRMFSTRGNVGGARGMNAAHRVGGNRDAKAPADREQRHDFRH